MKKLTTLVLMLSIFLSATADDCEGYIIKTSGDTVWGIVEVPINKAIIGQKSIIFGEMCYDIKFAEKGSKAKKQKAGEIAGFGFKYDAQWHHFEVLDFEKNYGKKIPKMIGIATNDMRMFLHRVQEGFFPIYYQHYLYDDSSPNSKFKVHRSDYDIYIKVPSHGYIEMEKELSEKKYKKLLEKELGMEKEFLDTLTKEDYEDSEKLFEKYNKWKNSK